MSWFTWTVITDLRYDEGYADPVALVKQDYIILRAKHDGKYYISKDLDNNDVIGPFKTLEAAKVYYRIMFS